MKAYEIWEKWGKVVRSNDYEIDSVPLKDIFSEMKALKEIISRDTLDPFGKEFHKYVRDRQIRERQEGKEINQNRRDLYKWGVAFVLIPILYLCLEFFYFGEIRNRPFLSIKYKTATAYRNHIEESNGKPYEDKTRKDAEVYADLINSGNFPANIVLINSYLSYGDEQKIPTHSEQKVLNIAPNNPVNYYNAFMIKEEFARDFTIETTIKYRGRKFFGWRYFGRPYEYYCRVKWNGEWFEVLKSEDVL